MFLQETKLKDFQDADVKNNPANENSDRKLQRAQE
jgi:hypothetical protein